MADDIEQRLTTAAEALREYEMTTRRSADLRRRMDEMTTQLAALRARHAREQEDVERLEGLSLTRVLVSLRGARDDALARERAEADAARYRVAEAEGRLDALRREHDVAQARLRQLAAAPGDYAAVLDDKERHLADSGDPRRATQLAVNGLTRFVDVWFDNIFTDLAVRDRIKQAEQNTAQAMQLVRDVQARLEQRAAQVRTRLATIDAERRHLLTQR